MYGGAASGIDDAQNWIGNASWSATATGTRELDTEYQARGRDDPVICAQRGSAKPSDPPDKMRLVVPASHRSPFLTAVNASENRGSNVAWFVLNHIGRIMPPNAPS